MKFGKNLSTKQAKYPSLRFLDYKGLKKGLKQQPEVFFTRLNEEIEGINACFSEQIASIRAALEECASLAEPIAQVLPSVMRIADQVEVLRRFAVWNAVGVVKIIKKHSKVSGLILPYSSLTTESWLSKQLFFSGSDFGEINATLESLSFQLARGRMTELAQKFPPQLQPHEQSAERCPICLERCEDAVELTSCGHRFCWKCVVLGPIAFAPGEYRLSKCAVCRNEQPLDPTRNFKSVGASRHLQLLAQLLDITSRDDEELSHLREAIACEDEGLEDLFNTTSGAAPKQPNEEKARQLLHEMEADHEGNMAESALFCCLCCEPLLLEAITTTPCKHHFHRVCLTKYDRTMCPLCDEELPPEILRPRYHWAWTRPVRYTNRSGASIQSFSMELIAKKRQLAATYRIHS